MSVFDDIIQRSKTGISRTEDYAKIYFSPPDYKDITVLADEDYKDFHFVIETCGTSPRTRILYKDDGISIHAGESDITLPDRNGENKKLHRKYRVVSYTYNKEGDCINNIKGHSGHKYTLKELLDDAKAFIDALIDQESKITDYMND